MKLCETEYFKFFMLEEENINDLVDRAKVKEQECNWVEAAQIYKEIGEFFIAKMNHRQSAIMYKNLGYMNSLAAETSESIEKYHQLKRNSSKAYSKAYELFKDYGEKEEELESKAEICIEKGSISSSRTDAEKQFRESLKLLLEASDLFKKKGDDLSYSRCLIRASFSIFNLSNFMTDFDELKSLISDGMELVDQAFESSNILSNINYLVEIFSHFVHLGLQHGFLTGMPTKKNYKEVEDLNFDMFKWYKRAQDVYNKSKNIKNPRIQGLSLYIFGFFHSYYGFYFSENQYDQDDIINEGFKLFEEAQILIQKSRDNNLKIQVIFWKNWFAFFGGKIEYVQKTINEDIQEIVKSGIIYKKSFSIWNFFSNYLPALFYSNVAQRSFFTLDQRISYAKKAIEYAHDSIKTISFEPHSAWTYQTLTLAFSQLVLLTESKNDREKYVENMTEMAIKADLIGKKYSAGLAKHAGISALYRAYKTIADITDDKIKKIDFLNKTINVINEYSEQPLDFRSGLIGTKIRTALLYEQLCTIKNEIQPLSNSREIYLSVIKESLDKGYYSYAAASYEYIARIEDRLNNHTSAAEYYEKAQNAYNESLKNIEYKPLRKRIEEKIKYSYSWSLIERAKVYHKQENHVKSKELYEEAIKVLILLKNYNFEASYYNAWIFLEESEFLSKNELHNEALKYYALTIEKFDEAIEVFQSKLEKTKERSENNRLRKLIKVAGVRKNYCSAKIYLEKARELEKQGNNLSAAENFASAASIFRKLCEVFKIESERIELEATYYLCRAWESMELAEKYKDPNRFKEAADLFNNASELFTGSNLKFLAQGNSFFCQALEKGSKFDESITLDTKAQLYPEIKLMLRNAADSYRKGDFSNATDWALGTSTYFDAAWSMIRADTIPNFEEKKKLLSIGGEFLKSAAEIFVKAGIFVTNILFLFPGVDLSFDTQKFQLLLSVDE